MFVELYVRHFVLIDELRLQFDRGLHVFTGETGAGKSLLLDATRVVLGGRASSGVVQPGADHAIVEAVFEIQPGSQAASLLDDWQIDVGDDGMVLLSRTVFANGRSTCRINGRSVTVQMLKSVGDTLVEMQGQHESQALLQKSYQRRLLDLYGQHLPLAEATAQAYREWQNMAKFVVEAEANERERAQQIDIYRFQIDEIERVNPQPGEEEALREERQRLLLYGKLQTQIERVASSLEDPSIGALGQLAAAEHDAVELASRVHSLANVADLLASARAQAEEAAFEISKFSARIQANPERLAEIEDRIVELRSLMRKYGASVAEVLSHLEHAKQELADLEKIDAHLGEHKEQLRVLEERYLQLAEELHQARVRSAAHLQEAILARLAQLQMGDARWRIDVTKDDSLQGEDGMDDVAFLFSANPGQPLMPLQKVASGGELSRTLLAIKVVVADLEQIGTLIFDEIDAGVSGEAAQRVAELLRILGRDRQVLCVTHAAQVAAAGHVHFEIAKQTRGNRAVTEIRTLTMEERRREVGRLLGAAASDETAVRHADALLESFRKDAIVCT
ncbi:DNA repair protein RecN [Alicyclobacillus acidiphilus]|uniref:DNA repair protein RecN n=1 Tax=Alicyclobacillus acidiphilus TaxID=182455 RepID=UPI00082D0DA9|nr:DNA repair protein RecN [Alicyclobacillus acidiphilus]